MSARDSEVQLLAKQLKAGEITKQELFERLAQLKLNRAAQEGAAGASAATSANAGR